MKMDWFCEVIAAVAELLGPAGVSLSACTLVALEK
jgi:hypothetical protein